MTEDRAVITGLGVISSNGIGKSAFFDGLFGGVSGVKQVSLFDISALEVKAAAEAADFSAQEFLGPRGLRTLDRSTKLAASAAKMALDDAGLKITEQNCRGIGIAIGDTLGSLSSISNFHKDALCDGARYVNPALFPNTVINSPASEVAIKFNIKGFSATIATGFSAGLDALSYGLDLLRDGRAKVVLAGGVEELCLQLFIGFYKSGLLAGLRGLGPELSCPFDKRRNGVILGEGAAVLVIEGLESALERKADIYAEVSGFGAGFDSSHGEGLKKAMRRALDDAQTGEDEIDYLCSGANSTVDADAMETAAIKEVFGGKAVGLKVSAIKSMIGECFSASGALQAAAAVAAIEKQAAPPTINYQEKDAACDLDYVPNKACACKIDNALVNSFSASGRSCSLILSKYKG